MRDSDLIIRDGASADLTADDTNDSYVDLGKGGVAFGLDLVVVVPEAGGTSPTLDITFKASDDQSAVKEQWKLPQITAAGVYRIRINTRRRYLKAEYDVGGTSPDFGAVDVRAGTGLSFREANIANS